MYVYMYTHIIYIYIYILYTIYDIYTIYPWGRFVRTRLSQGDWSLHRHRQELFRLRCSHGKTRDLSLTVILLHTPHDIIIFIMTPKLAFITNSANNQDLHKSFNLNHLLSLYTPQQTHICKTHHHVLVKHEFSISTLVDAWRKTWSNTKFLIIFLIYPQYIRIQSPYNH